MRVLRVPLQPIGFQVISLPLNSQILHLAPGRTNPELLDLWYLDRGDPQRRDIGIWIVGTGHVMPAALSQYGFHIGTVVMPSDLVWHAFEGPVYP